MNADFADLIECLNGENARYLLIGAHAMAAHGVPRATGDLDIWVDSVPENAARVWRALSRFGAPLADRGIRESDFSTPDVVVQFGVPPCRIDIATKVSGIEFAEAWTRRQEVHAFGRLVPSIGLEDLIANKLATGRRKDLVDVEVLQAKVAKRKKK